MSPYPRFAHYCVFALVTAPTNPVIPCFHKFERSGDGAVDVLTFSSCF